MYFIFIGGPRGKKICNFIVDNLSACLPSSLIQIKTRKHSIWFISSILIWLRAIAHWKQCQAQIEAQREMRCNFQQFYVINDRRTNFPFTIDSCCCLVVYEPSWIVLVPFWFNLKWADLIWTIFGPTSRRVTFQSKIASRRQKSICCCTRAPVQVAIGSLERAS